MKDKILQIHFTENGYLSQIDKECVCVCVRDRERERERE